MPSQYVDSQAAFLSTAESFAEQRQVSTREVLDEITAIVQTLMRRTDLAPVSDLSAADQEVLASSSGLSKEELAQAAGEVRTGGWARALLETALNDAASSLSTGQAAELLGIGDSAVRHRLRKGLLWSYVVGHAHRLPAWQFRTAGNHSQIAALPHLADLIAAIPSDATAAEVNGLMTTPQPSLEIADEPVTVPHWVLEGLPVERAVQTVRGLHELW